MFGFLKKKHSDNTEPSVKVDVTEDGMSGIRVVINGEEVVSNVDPGEWQYSKPTVSRTTELLIAIAKEDNSEFINVDDPKKALDIRNEIAASLAAGEEMKKTTARITPYVDGDEERAESIARTSVTHAYSASTLRFGEESGAVEKEWHALVLPLKKNGEKRKGSSCDDCAALDNRIVKLNKAFTVNGKSVQHPPLHEGCRCSMRLDYPYEPK